MAYPRPPLNTDAFKGGKDGGKRVGFTSMFPVVRTTTTKRKYILDGIDDVSACQMGNREHNVVVQVEMLTMPPPLC